MFLIVDSWCDMMIRVIFIFFNFWRIFVFFLEFMFEVVLFSIMILGFLVRVFVKVIFCFWFNDGFLLFFLIGKLGFSFLSLMVFRIFIILLFVRFFLRVMFFLIVFLKRYGCDGIQISFLLRRDLGGYFLILILFLVGLIIFEIIKVSVVFLIFEGFIMLRFLLKVIFLEIFFRI